MTAVCPIRRTHRILPSRHSRTMSKTHAIQQKLTWKLCHLCCYTIAILFLANDDALTLSDKNRKHQESNAKMYVNCKYLRSFSHLPSSRRYGGGRPVDDSQCKVPYEWSSFPLSRTNGVIECPIPSSLQIGGNNSVSISPLLAPSDGTMRWTTLATTYNVHITT